MREFEIFVFDNIADALCDIRTQFLSGNDTLVWRGPDELHYAVSAGSPSPSEQFSKEGLEYHKERGRDFWDVYTLIAFQFGIHNGTVSEENNTKILHSLIETYRKVIEIQKN